MGFSAEEILEEFAEASCRGREWLSPEGYSFRDVEARRRNNAASARRYYHLHRQRVLRRQGEYRRRLWAERGDAWRARLAVERRYTSKPEVRARRAARQRAYFRRVQADPKRKAAMAEARRQRYLRERAST